MNLRLTSLDRQRVRRRAMRVRCARAAGAFTLLEVIVACGVFFLVGFSILELVSRSLAAAKKLQNRDPDPGLVAAALSLTNRIEEGTLSGTFEDIAPNLYPGWRWEAFLEEVHSNSLFKVQIIVHNEGAQRMAGPQTLEYLTYRPGSPPGQRFGTFGGGVDGK
ncbi:MAG TPA: hypothetical protein VNO52_04110 [Methylomirabilota bacterium]|nr:hypothetical protein [Methylomirabilota bacterium]